MRILFILLSFIVFSVNTSLANSVYKIGVFGNTNNSIAMAAYNTVELLADKHNNTINSYEIKAVFFNESEGNLKDMVQNEPDLAAVIGCFSEEHRGLVENVKDVVLISICSQYADFIKNENTFRVTASEEQLARIQARIDYSVFGHRSFAVIFSTENEEYKKIADAYVDTVKSNKGLLTQYKEVEPDRTDFSNILMYLRDKKTRVIYFIGPRSQAALLAKQSRKMNVGAVFTSTSDIYSRSFIKAAKSGSEGAEFVTKTPPSLWRLKSFMGFYNEYNKKYDVTSIYMPYAYDAAKLAINGISAGNSGGKELAEYLKTTECEGRLGKIRFDELGNVRDPAFFLYVIRRGEFLYMSFNRKRQELYDKGVF